MKGKWIWDRKYQVYTIANIIPRKLNFGLPRFYFLGFFNLLDDR